MFYVVQTRNVNHAYERGLRYLVAQGTRSASRNGPVIVAPGPVCTTYSNPRERVLLMHPKRNANPFLHLAESLWMIAGRNDAAFLLQYTKQMKAYAEDDGNFHGAYGYRWRNHFELEGGGGEPDQLKTIINLLRINSNDRRVVLQMWDPVADLGKNKRDLPCNLCVLPRIVDGKLDITVMCRSNDAIWGAYGTNVVTFSVLQEYIAANIGVEVGRYYQISNNFHVYEDILGKHWPLDLGGQDPYPNSPPPQPLVDNPKWFDEELNKLFVALDTIIPVRNFKNSFLEHTAYPMLFAHQLWKEDLRDDAFSQAEAIASWDWRMAALDWFHKRRRSLNE